MPQEQSPVIERAPWVLGLGEQRLIRIPGLTRYSIGSPVIRAVRIGPTEPARAKSAGQELLVKAAQPGQSDLWVWKSDGTSEHRLIRVEKGIVTPLKPGLERTLSMLNEIEIL